MNATAIRLAAIVFPLAVLAAEPPAANVPQTPPQEQAAPAETPKASTISIPTLARSLESGLSRVRSIQKLARPSKESAKLERSVSEASARLAAMTASLRAAGPDEVSFRELDRMRVAWLEFDDTLSGW